jgi:hypothetical protein
MENNFFIESKVFRGQDRVFFGENGNQCCSCPRFPMQVFTRHLFVLWAVIRKCSPGCKPTKYGYGNDREKSKTAERAEKFPRVAEKCKATGTLFSLPMLCELPRMEMLLFPSLVGTTPECEATVRADRLLPQAFTGLFNRESSRADGCHLIQRFYFCRSFPRSRSRPSEQYFLRLEYSARLPEIHDYIRDSQFLMTHK